MRTYDLYIGGEDVAGSGWTYVVRASALIQDPVAAFNLKRRLELGEQDAPTDDVVGRCAWGDDAHNMAAVAAARAASVVYRQMPLEQRRAILEEFHAVVSAQADAFVDLLVAEGHPRRLAQWEVGGVLRGADTPTLAWYVEQLRQDFDHDGRRLTLVRKPDGVVCVNPPQNAAGSNSALASLALLAGNAIVVKAPRSTPLSVMFFYRELLAPILERHGAPAGTLNLVSGDTRRIIDGWLGSPDVNDLLFFGDSETGLDLGMRCIAAGKKPILELAGNDGFVVWHDARLDSAAMALTESFYGSSQICMVPKYAIVHPAVADAFLAELLPLVERIRPGLPEDPDVLLSPVLKSDRFYDFLGEARTDGAAVLTGGRRVGLDGEPAADGLFFEPTIVRVDGLEDARRLACVREETFFPLLPIVVAESAPDEQLLDQTIAFLNANDYGLRNSLWTGDDAVAARFARDVTNGGLLKINDSHIGFVSYLSTHGGTGRTGGPHGELNYVGLRTTHLQGIAWGDGEPQPLDPLVFRAASPAP